MGQEQFAFSIHSNSIDSTDIDATAMDIVLPDKLVGCISIRDFKSSICAINISVKKAIPKSHVEGSF